MAESFVLGNAPIPLTDAIARPRRRKHFRAGQDDPLEGMLTDPWTDYLTRLVTTVQAAATRVNSTAQTAQTGSIAATDISSGNLKAGVYRVSYYARITEPASISSSLQVTISWTDGGVAQSLTGAALTGNTSTTLETFSYLIHIDAGSPVRYAVAYGSAGTPMQYRLDVVLEVIDA